MMDVEPPTTPMSVEEAERIQYALRRRVRESADPVAPEVVAGVDVAYRSTDDTVAAAVVCLRAADLTEVDRATAVTRSSFPYIPGLLAFRELPAVVAALRRLTMSPDLMVCDGHGRAHPRRFGLACHLGVLTGVPTIGVAKNPPPFPTDPPATHRGATSPVRDGDELVGLALRTRDRVKPVYVSTGHLIGLTEARDLVLRLTPRYRQPETTRLADRLCRAALARA